MSGRLCRDGGRADRAVEEGVTALAGDRPLYAGLYLPELQGDDFDRAVKFAMAGGAKGVFLFGGLRAKAADPRS